MELLKFLQLFDARVSLIFRARIYLLYWLSRRVVLLKYLSTSASLCFRYFLIRTPAGISFRGNCWDSIQNLLVDLLRREIRFNIAFLASNYLPADLLLDIDICNFHLSHLFYHSIAGFFYYFTWVRESVLHRTSPFYSYWVRESVLHRTSPFNSFWVRESVLHWTSPFTFVGISTPLDFSV